MTSYNPSSDLWALLYDLDQALEEKARERGGVDRFDPLLLQRKQLRIMIQVHCPGEAPDEWRD